MSNPWAAMLQLQHLKTAFSEKRYQDAEKIVDNLIQTVGSVMDYYKASSSPPAPYVTELVSVARDTDWDTLKQEGKIKGRVNGVMTSGKYQAVLLESLTRVMKPKRILELGMFTGSTTVAFAACPSVEKVVTLDLEPYLETLARPYFEKSGHSDKIETKYGDCVEILNSLVASNEKFDLVYVDVGKDNYIPCYNIIMDKNLVAPGGVIIADNTLCHDKTCYSDKDIDQVPVGDFHRALFKDRKAFNELVRNDDRVRECMLPINDGITIIHRIK